MLNHPITFGNHRKVQTIPSGMDSWEHGYELGAAANSTIAEGSCPISHLEQLLNENQIHVARVEFRTEGIEAASVWEQGAVPVILLNSRSSRVGYSLSRRAILAHELCHLLHDAGEADLTTRVTLAETPNSFEDRIEQRARAFAPAFLAPQVRVMEWAEDQTAQTANESRSYTCAAFRPFL